MLKQCPSCMETKDVGEFYKDKRSRYGVTVYCKICVRRKQKERYDRDPKQWQDKVRSWRKKTGKKSNKPRPQRQRHASGLAWQDFDQIIADQEGRCAICDRQLDKPVIDHCHETKLIRGALCNRCNLGIGYFSDSPIILAAAAQYLTSPPSKRQLVYQGRKR